MQACAIARSNLVAGPTLLLSARLCFQRPISSSTRLATAGLDKTATPGSLGSDAADEPATKTTSVGASAAAYIAAQAAAEEAQEAEAVKSGQAKRPKVVPDPDAWRGEESRERMLKRILEDQYKPLRVKASSFLFFVKRRMSRCADFPRGVNLQGYQKPIPQPAPLPSQAFETAAPTPDYAAPAESGNPPRAQNPWDVVFKPPESYNPLPGYRSTYSDGASPVGSGTVSARKAAIATARKDASLSSRPSAYKKQRLANAYERSLDYRGGIRRPSGSARSGLGSGGGFDLMSGRGIAVPVHEQQSGQNAGGQAQDFQVWEGWLEEKIKQARKDGVFDKVEGRGKPIQRDHAESNPFIDRCALATLEASRQVRRGVDKCFTTGPSS